MLYVAWLSFHRKCHAPVLLSSRVSRESKRVRVVLHVFKYSYEDLVSQTANYGSLAKAMEKALNCCN